MKPVILPRNVAKLADSAFVWMTLRQWLVACFLCCLRQWKARTPRYWRTGQVLSANGRTWTGGSGWPGVVTSGEACWPAVAPPRYVSPPGRQTTAGAPWRHQAPGCPHRRHCCRLTSVIPCWCHCSQTWKARCMHVHYSEECHSEMVKAQMFLNSF